MGKISLSEAAKIMASSGGKATLEKYGKKHFAEMSEKRWGKKKVKKSK